MSTTAGRPGAALPHGRGRAILLMVCLLVGLIGAAPAVGSASAAPSVVSVFPSSGPVSGGTEVTISGTGLSGATGVTFGGAAGTALSVISDGQVKVTTPARGAGTVDVRVTTSSGTSPVSPSAKFRFGPSVTSVSPSSGPVGGGTVVTVSGAGLTGATRVTFGGTAGTALTVLSSTQVKVTTPARVAGIADVRVVTPMGTSPVSNAAKYTYTSPSIPPVVGHCGTLASDETWAAGATHVVDCDLVVPAGVRLSVLPGAVVKALPGAGLQVFGALSAVGTPTAPVTFTSVHDSSVGGDSDGPQTVALTTRSWNGVWGIEGGQVRLEHVVMRSGQGVSSQDLGTGVLVSSRFEAVDNVGLSGPGPFTVIGNSIVNAEPAPSAAALSVKQTGATGAGVVVRGNVVDTVLGQVDPFRSFDGRGLRVEVSDKLDGSAQAPDVRNNTVRRADGVAVVVIAQRLRAGLLTGNAGSGNRTNVLALAGTLETDLTLPRAGLPVALWNGSSAPNGASLLTVAPGVRLSVLPGAVVKALPGAGLQVFGALSAVGTPTAPVTFTSVHDSSVGGDSDGPQTVVPSSSSWSLSIGDGGTLHLETVDLRWGGIYGQSAGETVVRNSRFRDTSGVWIDGAGPFVLTSNAFRHVTPGDYKAAVTIAQRGAPAEVSVVGNTVDTVTGAPRAFDEFDGRGIVVTAQGPDKDARAPDVRNNVVRGTQGVAIVVAADHLQADRLTGNSGSDNRTNVLALAGTLDTDLSLPRAGLPVALVSYSERFYGFDVARSATLRLGPGTTIKVMDSAWCVPCVDAGRLTLEVAGRLQADGTATRPVTITSVLDETGGDTDGDNPDQPGARSWEGIALQPTATVTGTHLRLRYAENAIGGAGDVRLLDSGFRTVETALHFYKDAEHRPSVEVSATFADVGRISVNDGADMIVRGKLTSRLAGVSGPLVKACNWSTKQCHTDISYFDWGSPSGPFTSRGTLACGAVTATPWAGGTRSAAVPSFLTNCDGSVYDPQKDLDEGGEYARGRMAAVYATCVIGDPAFDEACSIYEQNKRCMAAAVELADAGSNFPVYREDGSYDESYIVEHGVAWLDETAPEVIHPALNASARSLEVINVLDIFEGLIDAQYACSP